ncbi:hypothetical protein MLD38_030979 [Melastoma candidum]|uniref:Uncharacterized protein n=1 Tax=Melastoma candidum TaxID=119954 RepID=A0ACB9MN55_9MYRT|nr:hypothetical protein MLD38_030979 [Melastoma candidum]
MGSQGGRGGGGGGGGNGAGGSMFGLTLDEVQTQLGNLGKPLGSMNLDELLRSVGEADSATRPLSGELRKKTVDEVWREIQSEKCGSGVGDGHKGDEGDGTEGGESVGERKPTFGEVTLEDFLVKAGVVAEIESLHGDKVGGVSEVGVGSGLPSSGTNLPHCVQWMQYPHQDMNQQNVVTVFPLPLPKDGIPPASMLADTRVHCQNMVMGRDRTVQRRQKRMIKNRESAARSRARKQAYTHELEHKVLRLEDENARLRRQIEVEQMFPSEPPAEPKAAKLRRTSSAPVRVSPPHMTPAFHSTGAS